MVPGRSVVIVIVPDDKREEICIPIPDSIENSINNCC